MPEMKVSKKASEKVFTIGDEVVHLEDLKVNKSTNSLGTNTFDKKISFSKNNRMEVDTSVVIFAGEPRKNKVVCTTECKSGYVIYKAGSEHLHAFPENIDPFPIIVRTKKDGELGFSVVPEDKMQDVIKSHEKMKADIHLHGIKIDREGFYDLNGVRKLLDLFGKSFSPDPRVKEQGIDLTKWEVGVVNPKEATKRMRLTLEIVLQDYYGISKAVEIAEQTYKFAHNPEVMKLIPDPVLPTFRQACKLR